MGTCVFASEGRGHLECGLLVFAGEANEADVFVGRRMGTTRGGFALGKLIFQTLNVFSGSLIHNREKGPIEIRTRRKAGRRGQAFDG